MKNKKGFTLIELLAVIVILALLVAVAVPAVTRYLNTSRKGTLSSSASAAISAVRNDYLERGFTKSLTYKLNSSYCDGDATKTTESACKTAGKDWVTGINTLLEKDLLTSPFNNTEYDDETSYVYVDYNSGSVKYYICLKDANGAGIKMEEQYVEGTNVVTTGISCIQANDTAGENWQNNFKPAD